MGEYFQYRCIKTDTGILSGMICFGNLMIPVMPVTQVDQRAMLNYHTLRLTRGPGSINDIGRAVRGQLQIECPRAKNRKRAEIILVLAFDPLPFTGRRLLINAY